jgi:hypothetical protein
LRIRRLIGVENRRRIYRFVEDSRRRWGVEDAALSPRDFFNGLLSLDLAFPLGAARFDEVAVNTQRGEAIAEGMAVECRAPIKLDPLGQSPFGHRFCNDGDRSFAAFGQSDDKLRARHGCDRPGP